MNNLTKSELKDISVFLNVGKYNLTAKESVVLLTLISKIDQNVKQIEAKEQADKILNTKDETKTENKNQTNKKTK